MNVREIEVLRCDGGWRDYAFVKLTADDGVVGWSELDDVYGAPAVPEMIGKLAPRVIGRSVHDHERIRAELRGMVRSAIPGAVTEALGAVENALLDAKAKALGVPCHVLLGGMVRDRVPVYWSHFATWRVVFSEHYGRAVRSLDDVRAAAAEVRDGGYRGLKTNILVFDDGEPRCLQPGFSAPFAPEVNVDRAMIRRLRDLLEACRDGAGPDVDLLLDLNFNAKPEGYVKAARALADFDLFWLELDGPDPEALRYVRSRSPHPIASLETLCGLREFLPYLRAQAVDVAIVDAVWNGVWQSMKIAAAAEAHEVNVAPHNFYGHLATAMNLHFAAAIPNLRVMEIDPDRLPWDDEIYPVAPRFENGEVLVPSAPGWGIEPDEAAVRARPPRGRAAGQFMDW